MERLSRSLLRTKCELQVNYRPDDLSQCFLQLDQCRKLKIVSECHRLLRLWHLALWKLRVGNAARILASEPATESAAVDNPKFSTTAKDNKQAHEDSRQRVEVCCY
jgi:hypothetical protein